MPLRTYPPRDTLRPWVRAYTLAEADALGNTHAVLPGLEPVLGLQYRGRVEALRDGSATMLGTIGITGLQDQVRTYRDLPRTGTVLVFFHPWGAAAFLPVPMHALAGRSVALEDLMPPAALREVEERLAACPGDPERLAVVEAFLLTLLRDRRPDGRLRRAARLLQEAPGRASVKDIASAVGVGERQLERKFREWVGLAPKPFARLARFQRLLRRMETTGRIAEAALDQGYYDQAHFIKDFRAFSGTTPEAYLRTLRGRA